ncbi:alpha/beta hydrolase [Mycolicibacterium smegmatis]|uniref:Alpha/beta hydrolase fold n=3 Tax=Mycolicibacterium smegmatis TaxID=1772 RepID=A0QP57_MYCS2|nr:alpha/beta hydrolase [Mycolicibacterium smegmatis]ABK75813.1 alpha/beta hydrolase fold [Mycolicibacterium smegmatis MC2 155]AFP36754.1 Alpha/beta hydrolase fold-3 [Mycolicibacterium smegmatis MC2 155]AIU05559.1 alpha/beta hydrolase [Mycolicibacterium smegmatis MC2 155]AIU12184.1 alpha/beta hydrolase [Mycolicibacterium smegmatis]AIU18808.1 alpha/beta hydrolase [Mycolicibacterium smegmatis]
MTATTPTRFHPDLERVARYIPRHMVNRATLPVFQRLTRLMGRRVPPGCEVLTLPSGVGIRLFRPPASTTLPGPALVWIHGGGYVLGSAAQDDAQCLQFARQAGVTVASVEYRLAPQNPYPAGLEDCFAALRWLTALPSVDPARVAIGGASAGGGLAASLALLARDRGIDVAAQLLVYPMLDDRSSFVPSLDHPGQRLWNQGSNRFGWKAYLGDADPDVAVPARREDLSGLPPAWVGVGTLDLFHDEDLAYAGRLHAAGVPCEIDVVHGAFHGFDGVAPKAAVSRAFRNAQCAFLKRALT